MSRKLVLWGVILLVLGVALGLRLWGNTFGLPYRYASDEWQKVADARALADNGFRHTAMQPSFLYNSLWVISNLASPWADAWVAEQDLRPAAADQIENSYYVWLGRSWTAVLGTGTVLAVFWLGRRVGGTGAGLAAAAACAVSPLPVVAAHYIKEDVPLALGVALTLGMVMRLIDAPTRRNYVLAGLVCGASCALKFPAIALFGLIVVAHLMVRRERRLSGAEAAPAEAWYRDRNLWAAAGCVVLGFFILSPNGLLYPKKMLGGMFTQSAYLGKGHHDGIGIWPWEYGMAFYLREALIPGMTVPVLIAAVAGVAVLWRRNRRAAVILTAWVAAYYVMIECSRAKPYPFFARYALPLVPAICVLSGVAVSAGVAWVHQQRKLFSAPMFAAAALQLAMLAYPAYVSLRYASDMESDTRDAAQAWIESHLPPGARVAFTSFGPNVDESIYRGMLLSYMDEPMDLRAAIEEPTYFVLSSFAYERFIEHPEKRPEWAAFYQQLLKDGQRVQEFTPRYGSYGFNNPTVSILKLMPRLLGDERTVDATPDLTLLPEVSEEAASLSSDGVQ